MNNYCAEPQAHPDRCGCKPDSFQIARHSRRLVEQQRERIAALEAECERLADELDRNSTITGDYIARCQRLADERDALAAERARADVAVADANDAERALVAVTAERDRLQSQLAEAQANDRTAMGYLHDVRQLVGGSDFPEMVRNVARMADALPGCVELIETLSPFEGDVLRKAYAAMAAKEASDEPS